MSLFVTFEGGDGVGKSTQIGLLAEALRGRGRTVVTTREPGGSAAAETIRSMLLDPDLPLDRDAEILLLFAGRADHIATTVLPALSRGEIVLCDRFYDSTLVYQGAGVEADDDAMAWLRTLVTRVRRRPDLTLVLDLPPEESHRRALLRSATLNGPGADRYEGRDIAFHRRVREGFRDRCRIEPERCLLIDALGATDAVHARVLDALGRRLPR